MPEPASPSSVRDRGVARTLWIVLGLNLCVASVKLSVGAVIGSLALVADGFHAVLDASSNVVGLVGVAVASRPPDPGHPYGHRRFESMAGFIIGLLIAAGMIEIGGSLIDGITGSRPEMEVSWEAALAVFATVVVNVFITRYERRKGRELESSLLMADAAHTLSDTFGAIAVLCSLGAAALGLPWADQVATVVVLVLIARTALSVLRENTDVLVDAARLDPAHVHGVVTAVPGVRGAHKIRSRGKRDHVFVDLHIHLDPAMPLLEAHALTHRVADAIRQSCPGVADVVIHTEPADGREEASPTPQPPSK